VSTPNSVSWPLAVALPAPVAGAEEAAEPGPEHARWFQEEVQPYEEKLRAYLRHRFPTISDVDDIVQETYARLFRERRAGRVFEARSYLFPVARNVAFDIFRRSRTIAIGGLGEMASLGVLEERPDAAEAASRDQEVELLHEAIALLPERCREVFALRRLQGLSHREIAMRLGISENTVDAQLCNAIFRCRQYFVARGVERGRLQEMNPFRAVAGSNERSR
jgi:RNA polymerase sigma-70 factor (ECF subfamily)